MKLTIIIATIAAAFAVIPRDEVSPVFESVPIVHAGSKEPKPSLEAPSYSNCTRAFDGLRVLSAEASPDGVPSPVHCTTCGMGVYSIHEDGSMRCSYCKHSQE